VGAWDPHDDLEDWIAGRLGDQYPALAARATELGGRSRSIARALLAQERVLPILDGLDEMTLANRGKALKQLSSAIRRGQRLVLTCRTREYRDLTDGPDQEQLAQTLVVELAPVTPADIRTYLLGTTTAPASRWDPVFTELDAHPEGVLAEVLSTPLMVWLARIVYKQSHTDPARLVELATSVDQVRQHLLDGLIPAAYAERSRLSRYPAREGKSLIPVRTALTVLARHLQARNSQNFAWWRLHEAVSRKAIAASVAVATGSVLGAAFGLAVSIKAGLAAGLVAGLANAVVGGALCTLTVLSPQELPRVLNFRFSLFGLRYKLLGGLTSGLAVGLTFGYACARGGGPWSAVIVFVVVTPVAIAGVGAVFGLLSGITGGISAGLSFGLAAILVNHRSSGIAAGVTTGVVFTATAWIWTGLYQKTTVTRAVSPDYLYRGDRTSSLVVGVSAGLAYGLAYAFALGPWIGILGTFALAFAVTLTVSTWGEFVIARLWLSPRHKMPFDLMGLLREAHERGVIRQNGTYYQFRHSLLQDRLATAAPAFEPDTPKTSASGRPNYSPEK
jgi:NACHT domain